MSVSVFDHPWLSALLGDAEIARQFTGEAELRAILEFEVALAMAEAELGFIPIEAAQAIGKNIVAMKLTVPSPVPVAPLLMVSHCTLLTAVQPQPARFVPGAFRGTSVRCAF